MKRIIVFWHNYLVNDWKKIVTEQFGKLVSSDLYGVCEAVKNGVVCNSQDEANEHQVLMVDLAKEHQVDPGKLQATYVFENNYEYCTLKMLQDFAQSNDAYVLYFHTKGVSCPPSYKRFKAKKEHKRRHMEEVNILGWSGCVEKLDEGYLCCGTNKKWKFYSGNFWWANTDYIKTLPNLDKLSPGHGNYSYY